MIIKIISLSFLSSLMLFSSQSAMAGPSDYKMKVHNASPYPLKMAWYCKGKRKDFDTFPPGQKKMRQLSSSKCGNIKDVSVKFSLKHSFGVAAMNAYFRPSAYVSPLPSFEGGDSSRGFIRFIKSLSNRNAKAIYKAGYLTKIKFDKIPGNGKKRCVVVTKDIGMRPSIESILGIPMPAVYPVLVSGVSGKKC